MEQLTPNVEMEPISRHQFDYYCTLSKQWIAIYLSSPIDSVTQIKNNYIQEGFAVRNPS